MAKYTGYVTIPHATYDEWRGATLNNGYDADGYYGCQCWDFAAEFWWNIGFPQGYPTTGGTGSAYAIWDNREANKGYNGVIYFDLITNLNDVKRGDIIVYSPIPNINPYGHVGFADQDYATWTPPAGQPYEFPILSENNSGTPDPAGGAYVNVKGYDTRYFRGAFRYKEWKSGPVPPTPTDRKKHKFPWVLYARKLRNNRYM